MAEIEIQPENEVKYQDVAPVVSKHIPFADIPSKGVSEVKPVAKITKVKVQLVLSDNSSPSNVASKVGLSKGQVMKIRKEYQAAIRHKSYGGVE